MADFEILIFGEGAGVYLRFYCISALKCKDIVSTGFDIVFFLFSCAMF